MSGQVDGVIEEGAGGGRSVYVDPPTYSTYSPKYESREIGGGDSYRLKPVTNMHMVEPIQEK